MWICRNGLWTWPSNITLPWWQSVTWHGGSHCYPRTGTIIVNRCRLEKTINKVSIVITRVIGSCDGWWCMDRPTTRKYDFTSKTFGDLIQPKNCEISNSGGNIFCWLVSLLSELKTQDCRVCSLVLNVQIIVSQLFVHFEPSAMSCLSCLSVCWHCPPQQWVSSVQYRWLPTSLLPVIPANMDHWPLFTKRTKYCGTYRISDLIW